MTTGHAQSLARLALRTATLDLRDPHNLILVHLNMGQMAVLAQIVLDDAAKEEAEDEHECDGEAEVDNDICSSCGEHTGFCSVCGSSECCG